MGTAAIPRTNPSEIPEPRIARLLFANTYPAPLWLIIRLYVGYEWLMAGYEKFTDPAGVWVGAKAGTAIMGFAKGALAKTGGEHPNVAGWYAAFLQNVVMPNAALWGYLITAGEILVGLGLIVGLFTGIAAFFGGFMNANYLLAGTVLAKPKVFILGTGVGLGGGGGGGGGAGRA